MLKLIQIRVLIVVCFLCVMSAVACRAETDGFKLCYTEYPDEFIEFLEDGTSFRTMDYFGDTTFCEGSKSCIQKPLLISIPPPDLKNIDQEYRWIDGGYDFSIRPIGERTFQIEVSAEWGTEAYTYSEIDGFTEGAVVTSMSDVEVWRRCGGSLNFESLKKTLKKMSDKAG